MQPTGFQEKGEGVLNITRSACAVPIIFVQGLILFKALVLAWSSWEWPVANPGQPYMFLSINRLAMLLGYIEAARERALGLYRIGTFASVPRLSAFVGTVYVPPFNFLNRVSLAPWTRSHLTAAEVGGTVQE